MKDLFYICRFQLRCESNKLTKISPSNMLLTLCCPSACVTVFLDNNQKRARPGPKGNPRANSLNTSVLACSYSSFPFSPTRSTASSPHSLRASPRRLRRTTQPRRRRRADLRLWLTHPLMDCKVTWIYLLQYFFSLPTCILTDPYTDPVSVHLPTNRVTNSQNKPMDPNNATGTPPEPCSAS